jgi:hypothetical protein
MRQKLDIKSGLKLAEKLEGQESPPAEELEGLTDEQQVILRLRLRGMTIRAIAKGMNVSPAVIHREVTKIREIKAESLTSRPTEHHAADAITLYEEVEQSALEIYTESGSDRNMQLRALSTALQARDKHVKLLMDLGIMQKAQVDKPTTNINIGILEGWSGQVKQMVTNSILEAQLTPLEAPVPLLEAAAGVPPEDTEPAPPLAVPKLEEYDLAEFEEESDGESEEE